MSRRNLLFRAVLVPVAGAAVLIWAFERSGYSYTRVAVFVAAFVLVADLASFLRGTLQNILVVVATLLLGASVIETYAQVRQAHVNVEHPPGLWTDRAEIGWGPARPGIYPVEKITNGKVIYTATYTIDDDLLRSVKSPIDAPTIAFLGDSFTFGDGVDDAATLPQAFADLAPRLHVVNMAFSAYSPSQALRELQVGLFDKALTHPRLFVLATGPFHAERTACKASFSIRGPRYVVSNGAPRYAGPCASGFKRRWLEFVKELAGYNVFVAPVVQRPTHVDIDAYIDIVAAVAKIAREKYHAPLVVMLLPPEDHYLDGTGFTIEQIAARMTAAGVHVMDAAIESEPYDKLIIPGDGHWNALGNALMAKRLFAYLSNTTPDILRTDSASVGR